MNTATWARWQRIMAYCGASLAELGEQGQFDCSRCGRLSLRPNVWWCDDWECTAGPSDPPYRKEHLHYSCPECGYSWIEDVKGDGT